MAARETTGWANRMGLPGKLFPDLLRVSREAEHLEGETRGGWYLRQLLGSANITGSPPVHLMSRNLSYQIEHHLPSPTCRAIQVSPLARG
jgi:linoleoyl-CoA desaturase